MSKDNGLKSNWSRVWGKQLADKEMCERYREGWERIWGDKEKYDTYCNNEELAE